MSSNRAGLASHLAVGTAALAAGVGLSLLFRPAPHHPLDPVTTHGEWIHVRKPSGDSIRAYIAYPERKDAAPSVIVIHEIFGLTDWEPTVADKLAGKGYVAIVPDLLSSRWGMSPPSADSARKLMGQLVPDDVTADLDVVYEYVNGLPSVATGHTGVIGFCWGGGQSFRYATNNPKLKAAVVCYGVNPDSAALARIEAPVLGVYGEDDARIDSRIPDVVRLMDGLGKRYDHDIYPGTGHGFLKPGRRGSDTDQVDKAWDRILGFLGRNLEGR